MRECMVAREGREGETYVAILTNVFGFEEGFEEWVGNVAYLPYFAVFADGFAVEEVAFFLC